MSGVVAAVAWTVTASPRTITARLSRKKPVIPAARSVSARHGITLGSWTPTAMIAAPGTHDVDLDHAEALVEQQPGEDRDQRRGERSERPAQRRHDGEGEHDRRNDPFRVDASREQQVREQHRRQWAERRHERDGRRPLPLTEAEDNAVLASSTATDAACSARRCPDACQLPTVGVNGTTSAQLSASRTPGAAAADYKPTKRFVSP